jgi:Ca2+/Na+ antiporter
VLLLLLLCTDLLCLVMWWFRVIVVGSVGATLMALGCSAPEFFTNVGSVIFSSEGVYYYY